MGLEQEKDSRILILGWWMENSSCFLMMSIRKSPNNIGRLSLEKFSTLVNKPDFKLMTYVLNSVYEATHVCSWD